MSKMFHLGWFLGSGVKIQGWGEPGAPRGYDWSQPDLFVDTTRALERACFDLLIIEDSSAVPYTYKNSMDYYLKNTRSTPKMDPAPLTSYLAAATKHIGIAPTLTSTFYPPWLLARLMATLDHFSSGRIGWNIVTATSDAAAQNYGYDKQFEHDLRYDMADEYIDLVSQLWDAWEPDAVVMDEDSGTFIDPSKVKAVHFEGQFYKCRGPLNVPRSPQGKPLFVAPGGSPRGRKFSGRNAEVVLAGGGSIAEMKDYREEVHRHAVAFGRDPTTCKTLFTCNPTLTRTKQEAEDIKERASKVRIKNFEGRLAGMSFTSGIDFSKFDLDEPIGEIRTNGEQTMLKHFKDPNMTLRQFFEKPQGQQLVGTADMVASYMEETMQEVGGDGFLIGGQFMPKHVSAIVDELVPVLQKRGLTRTEYGNGYLRDNVMAF